MAGRQPRLTSDELLRALRQEGWYVSRQSGSHAVLKNALRPGRVVVPRHKGKTLKAGTLSAILEQANISPDELKELL
ncbi:MAG: type II toxin-antitoxin system HicA family toxin [Dehalococcoidia bacterium]